MIFKNLCILVLWMIVASALEGLRVPLSPFTCRQHCVQKIRVLMYMYLHPLVFSNGTGSCMSTICRCPVFFTDDGDHWKWIWRLPWWRGYSENVSHSLSVPSIIMRFKALGNDLIEYVYPHLLLVKIKFYERPDLVRHRMYQWLVLILWYTNVRAIQ